GLQLLQRDGTGNESSREGDLGTFSRLRTRTFPLRRRIVQAIRTARSGGSRARQPAAGAAFRKSSRFRSQGTGAGGRSAGTRCAIRRQGGGEPSLARLPDAAQR